MSKAHDLSITDHFIVSGNVRVVISGNVPVYMYTGLHSYAPYFSRLGCTTGKIAIAHTVITLLLHIKPQFKTNE